MFGLIKNIRIKLFLKFFFVFLFVFIWIFSSWPRIWNNPQFPPEIREARAATSAVYPTANNGGWDANETYAYADDTSYASTAPSVNSTESVEYGNFGFDSSVPAGATINSVTIELVWYVSTTASNATLLVDALVNNGAVGTQQFDTSEPLSDKLTSYANNYASWTRDLLLNGVFEVRVGAQRGSGANSYTMYLDYVKVTVDYTLIVAPTVTTQAADPVGDTTATCNGTITATGGANATAVGCEWDTDSGAPYANNPSTAGDYGAAPFTQSLTSLPSGTTIYARAFATNTAGTGYGSEVSFLTKPAAPTGVAATDGTYTDKVTITWTKSTGATDYHVWRNSTDLGSAGDVATFDDSGADAPTITAGSAVASDGTNSSYVELSLSGTSANNGTLHTYKVVASNATGNSADSSTDTGYRGVGSLTYQWQRSIADSDADYSNIDGATTAAYNDTGAPADGSGRYYKCILNATGAAEQVSAADRGFKGIISIVLETGSGTVTYGIVATSQDTTASGVNQTQTVRNNGNVAEDFDIKGQSSANWTLAGAAGDATYKHEWCTSDCDSSPVWNVMTTTYDGNYFASNVIPDGTVNFDLKVTVPTSNAGTSSENVSVFIQATQH